MDLWFRPARSMLKDWDRRCRRGENVRRSILRINIYQVQEYRLKNEMIRHCLCKGCTRHQREPSSYRSRPGPTIARPFNENGTRLRKFRIGYAYYGL